jgi:selenium metabolism protein YedF
LKTVDARGQACPQPVLLTRKALTEASEVLVIVDNDTAQLNVSRMAEKSGHRVDAAQKADGIYLHITRTAGFTTADAIHHVSNLVVLVAGDTLGRGEAELGNILIRGFLHTLNEVEPLPTTLVFINSGVKLVGEGSVVLDDLRALRDKGVEVLACGTCLDYYALKDRVAVGQISNMYSIAEALLRADQVISI